MLDKIFLLLRSRRRGANLQPRRSVNTSSAKQVVFDFNKSANRTKPCVESPQLKALWRSLIEEYFPQRLDLLSYTVTWSIRPQKRTLASCNLRDRRINVARELAITDYERWLAPLLYHELCHAVLGPQPKQKPGKGRWHNQEFRRLESQHPLMAEFNSWVKSGGWHQAIRRDRARRAAAKRRNESS